VLAASPPVRFRARRRLKVRPSEPFLSLGRGWGVGKQTNPYYICMYCCIALTRCLS